MMSSYSKVKRSAHVLVPALVVAALLLGACGGAAQVDAAADVEVDPVPENADNAEAGAEAEASTEMETEAEVGVETEAEDPVEDEEPEAQTEDEGYPELVLGDAAFRVTDPGTVTLASGQVQLVEFFAHWCTICKAIAPTVHGLEDIYGDRVNFVYLDRDDPATADLQAQLGYVYQPHIFILDPQGNVLFESLSYVEGIVLQEAIEQALQ